MNGNQLDFSSTGYPVTGPGAGYPVTGPGAGYPVTGQVAGKKPSDTLAVSTASSTRRRKTTKEQFQDALAIQNDYKNRNIVTDPDREEDEYFCFIGKYPRWPA